MPGAANVALPNSPQKNLSVAIPDGLNVGWL